MLTDPFFKSVQLLRTCDSVPCACGGVPLLRRVTFATKCTRMRDDAVAVDGIAVAIIPARDSK